MVLKFVEECKSFFLLFHDCIHWDRAHLSCVHIEAARYFLENFANGPSKKDSIMTKNSMPVMQMYPYSHLYFNNIYYLSLNNFYYSSLFSNISFQPFIFTFSLRHFLKEVSGMDVANPSGPV